MERRHRGGLRAPLPGPLLSQHTHDAKGVLEATAAAAAAAAAGGVGVRVPGLEVRVRVVQDGLLVDLAAGRREESEEAVGCEEEEELRV